MTGTNLCVNNPQSVPVIFEPPCILTGKTVALRFQNLCCDEGYFGLPHSSIRTSRLSVFGPLQNTKDKTDGNNRRDPL